MAVGSIVPSTASGVASVPLRNSGVLDNADLQLSKKEGSLARWGSLDGIPSISRINGPWRCGGKSQYL